MVWGGTTVDSGRGICTCVVGGVVLFGGWRLALLRTLGSCIDRWMVPASWLGRASPLVLSEFDVDGTGPG